MRQIQQLPKFWCLLLGSVKLTTFMINNDINLLAACAAEVRLFVKISCFRRERVSILLALKNNLLKVFQHDSCE